MGRAGSVWGGGEIMQKAVTLQSDLLFLCSFLVSASDK